MPVPTYDNFIAPLIRYLASQPGGASVASAYDEVAGALKLTPDDRAEMLPSGRQPVFRNRIGWAHDRLKRAGLSESPQRGIWRLTPQGRDYAKKNPTVSDEEVERIATVEKGSKATPSKEGIPSSAQPAVKPAPQVDKVAPEERIDAALAELRSSVSRDLLENIGRSPPEFFERLVIDLLLAMGYGADRDALQRVGGSGDGGIDGIISLDRLGLEKVYVQAKRWKNNVGSPEIQGFMGALQLQGATKGVFITTSLFSKEATAAAGKAAGKLVLVNGTRLTELMIEYGVAVQHKSLRVPKIDSDYFDEG